MLAESDVRMIEDWLTEQTTAVRAAGIHRLATRAIENGDVARAFEISETLEGSRLTLYAEIAVALFDTSPEDAVAFVAKLERDRGNATARRGSAHQGPAEKL